MDPFDDIVLSKTEVISINQHTDYWLWTQEDDVLILNPAITLLTGLFFSFYTTRKQLTKIKTPDVFDLFVRGEGDSGVYNHKVSRSKALNTKQEQAWNFLDFQTNTS